MILPLDIIFFGANHFPVYRGRLAIGPCQIPQNIHRTLPEPFWIDKMGNSLGVADNNRLWIVLNQISTSTGMIKMDMSEKNIINTFDSYLS